MQVSDVAPQDCSIEGPHLVMERLAQLLDVDARLVHDEVEDLLHQHRVAPASGEPLTQPLHGASVTHCCHDRFPQVMLKSRQETITPSTCT